MKYRPDLDTVLNKLDFVIEAGHKVGVVGRTGAGKTTMSLCLSRICELESGSIEIDDINIEKINLHYLRQKITVIPQEPVIFRDTIKFNLDPNGTATDKEIEDLLILAGLEELLKREPEKRSEKKDNENKYFEELLEDKGNGKGIYFRMNDGGDSLSVGEKQLLAICRAVFRKNKIVVMDEATANIDIVTEEKIQKLMHTAFKDSTVITIAHRLNTIMNGDRVLVLDEGRVLEYDEPGKLANDPKSRLYEMLTEIKKD